MKLQKLTIQNIASIESAEIEFDKGALAEDPLFLITGRTGAGKTTILNAICLALYDAVPCLTGVKDDRNRDDDLKITSPGQLMRKGAKKAEVTLTFVSGDTVYLARWEAHYSNRRTKGEHRKLLLSRSLTNVGTGETLTKKGDISAAVQTAVGLTFEQFTRTTMLAQGQFAAFMRADEKDKADILEKLTGTCIYTRIGQTVFELMREAEALHSRLAAETGEIKLLTEEEKQEINERINALKLTATTATLRIAEIDRQLEWLRGYERLHKSLQECGAEYEQAKETVAGEEYREKVSAIARYDATAHIRTLIRQAADMAKKVETLVADLENYGQKTARMIADGLLAVNDKIQKTGDKRENVAAEIKKLQPRNGVYGDILRIDEKSSQLKSVIASHSKTATDVQNTESDLAASRKAETPLSDDIISLDKVSAGFDAILAGIDAELGKNDRSALAEEKKAADSETLRINRTIQLLETLASRRSDLREVCEREEQNAAALKLSQEELAGVEEDIPRLADHYHRCKAFLDGQQTIADHIGELRNLYAESHRCPLCGNTHAEMPHDDTISEMLAQAKKEADDANRSLVDAKARQKSLNKDIATLGKRASDIAEEKKRKNAMVQATVDELVSLGNTEIGGISADLLKEKVLALGEKSGNLEKRISEIDALMARRLEVADKKEKVIAKKDKAQKKLQKQQQETVKLAETLRQQQQQLKDLADATASTLTELSGLTGMDLKADTYADTVDSLKKEAKRYSQLNEARAEYDKEEENLNKILASCNALLPADAAHYAEGYVAQPKELADPEIEISEFGSTLSRKSGEIATGRKQLADIRAEIDAIFAEAEFTCEDVDQISRMSEPEVKEWKDEVKKAADALTFAEGAVKAVNRQVAEHDAAKPGIEAEATVDTLQEEKNLQEKTRDTAKEESIGMTRRLEEDDRLHETYEEKIRRLEEAAGQLNEWRLLNSVFGSADGARFRAIAQSYVLRALLARANQYLTWLSSRYMLDCKDGSLAIDVIDMSHGNTVRNVSLLSGGESFVVSLALALGLSAISKDKIDVDILFIDEGFGTLDHDTLETVIETLDSLHRRGGRRIGIISHVAQLVERIPTQIRLVPDGPSSSRVVIV